MSADSKVPGHLFPPHRDHDCSDDRHLHDRPCPSQSAAGQTGGDQDAVFARQAEQRDEKAQSEEWIVIEVAEERVA